MAAMGQDSDSAGHRGRLRARLLAEPQSLADYELVEYLLTLAIPRQDVKPLAKALLREFGGLSRLFSADAESLMRVAGIKEGAAAALRIVGQASRTMLEERVSDQPVLASWQALLDYLRVELAGLAVEHVRVLHLDTKNVLIRNELMAEGSIDQAAVPVREVIRRALELGSAAIILVHNHPSGDPQPSRADIQLTRDIVEAGKRLGISVHDHVIMASSGHSSLRAMGLI